MTYNEQILNVMIDYQSKKKYREKVNNSDLSSLSEIEQIALNDLIITTDGIEIIYSDLSNYYDSYNDVDLESEKGLMNTCMNMAIACLLNQAFQENNIHKYQQFGLVDIKSRMKGTIQLYSAFDKPKIIEFIRWYNECFPLYLPNKAKEYLKIYNGHIKNGVGPETFRALAYTFNTNIYMGELSSKTSEDEFVKEKRRFWKRK